jgi:hypothetical protein
MGRMETLGEAVPRCNAKLRGGGRCIAFPALHPRSSAHYVASGRCALHGGTSTGPRTAEGKTAISDAARRRWAATFEAEGRTRPSDALRTRVAVYLEARTWDQAIFGTGLSRQTLLRIERGGYCGEGELLTVRRAIGFFGDAATDDPWPAESQTG